MDAERFFAFMVSREKIRLQKEAGCPWPWTQDPILQTYKFTNVFREHDRTSRLLREEFYEPNRSASPIDILMNAALFRYFGTIEFARAVGWQTHEDFGFEFIRATACARLEAGDKVFTGAYVITNQGISDRKENVVVNIFLRGIHAKAKDIVRSVQLTSQWRVAVEQMSRISGFGGTGFMAKEVLLDTTYTDFWSQTIPVTYRIDGKTYPKDWWQWTPIGPGGLRGAARVLGAAKASPAEAARLIRELYEAQDKYWPMPWPRLCPHDVQFQLCEFDKYERVRLGEGRPRSKYRHG